MSIYEAAKEKLFIVAHRGVAGGNIPCNTIPAYEAALRQGADMIEIDVARTKDNILVVFHPGMENEHLGINTKLSEMSWEEVAACRYLNYDRVPTQFGIHTLDEVFENFKGRCFINVDKFWYNPELIQAAIKHHGIEEQVLVKSTVNDKVLSVLQKVAPTLPFMAVVSNTHPMHETLMKMDIHYVGAEVLFTDDAAEVASSAFMDRMHKDGRLVWVNSIIYNCKKQLAAGHSDDTAIAGDPENGWGWLARRGFDLIQTDWPLMMKKYLEEQELLSK